MASKASGLWQHLLLQKFHFTNIFPVLLPGMCWSLTVATETPEFIKKQQSLMTSAGAMFLVRIGVPRPSLDNLFSSLQSRQVGFNYFKKHMLLPLADNTCACPKNSRQSFLRRQERSPYPQNRGNVSPVGRCSDQEHSQQQEITPWGQQPALLRALMLWNPPNPPHFTGKHNQWCWWAGSDDPVTHRHGDWTTKAANFAVRVFRVGRIQCKIHQGCSSRIPWPWKSGGDLMPGEKEEWWFPWIPTGSTQLRPLPAITDKVVLLSCKKRTAAG